MSAEIPKLVGPLLQEYMTVMEKELRGCSNIMGWRLLALSPKN